MLNINSTSSLYAAAGKAVEQLAVMEVQVRRLKTGSRLNIKPFSLWQHINNKHSSGYDGKLNQSRAYTMKDNSVP
jgi:hypothetical protein